MFFKSFFYQPIISKEPSTTKWIVKSDKSERSGKSDVELTADDSLLKAKIKLHYLNGQEGPVGFITFRRKCIPYFKLGLSLNVFCEKSINLAMVVNTKSEQLFVYDIVGVTEDKTFYISWKNFYPSRRGKKIQTKEKLKAKNIREIGILIQRSKQEKEILYQEKIQREIFLRAPTNTFF